jgi:hypothetical protein
MKDRWRVWLTVGLALAAMACAPLGSPTARKPTPTRPVAAATPLPTASLERLSAEVWHRPSGDVDREVTRPTGAGAGDRVWTKDVGKALLWWPDLYLQLYRDTQTHVEDVTPTNLSMGLAAGTALQGESPGARQRIQWTTDNAEILLTGTTVQITYVPSAQATLVRVFDGHAEVRNRAGQAQRDWVGARQWVLVDQGAKSQVSSNLQGMRTLVDGWGLWDLFHEVEQDVQAGFGPAGAQVPGERVDIVFAGSPPSPTPEPMCTVQSSSLNLRPGPGEAYVPPRASLVRGTALEPLSYYPRGFPAGSWVEVRVLSTGAVGWVSAGAAYVACNLDLTRLPRGSAPPTPTPTQPPPTVTPTPIPPDVTDPPPPRLLIPRAGEIVYCPYTGPGSADLIWEAVTDQSGIARYEIELTWYTFYGYSQDTTIVTVGGSQTEYILQIDCNNEYTWRVRAVDGRGNVGGWSASRTFKTRPGIGERPRAPGRLAGARMTLARPCRESL